ncbi:hypothetical protein V498_03190 [Pseudogymnoascus sp. VKM F-4517 (FW-2822)]|nr:hypothetical protein V498_03190 [Pseudogymnoascus sp. VKM F-4517 (FW-2822)]
MRPETSKNNPKATANGFANDTNFRQPSPFSTPPPHQLSPSSTPPQPLNLLDTITDSHLRRPRHDSSTPSTPSPTFFPAVTMSTYRPSTRASSAAASITGGTRAAATPATPSASRAGRKKRGPSTIASELGPQVIATKESTSYGSSGAVVPMALDRMEEGDLRGALTGIVAPKTVGTPAGQRATTGSVPPTGASTSFGQESSLAGNGTFTGVPVIAPLGLAAGRSRRGKSVAPPVEEPAPQPRRTPTPPPPAVEELPAANPVAAAIQPAPIALAAGSATDLVVRARSVAVSALKNATVRLFLAGLLSAIVAMAFLGTSEGSVGRATRMYAQGASATLAQYIPHGVAHPLNYFNEADMLDVQRRLRRAELSISKLQADVAKNQELTRALEKRLPDFLVVSRVRGKVQIPADFWRALKTTILADNDVRPFKPGKPETSAPLTATPDWDDFLRTNEARLRDLVASDVQLARADVLAHLQAALASTSTEYSSALAKATQAVKSELSAQIAELPPSVSAADIDAHAERAMQRVFLSSRIEALINAKLAESSSSSLSRVNYFSPATGAVVNPTLTSATYSPRSVLDPSNLITGFLKLFSYPLPKIGTPVDALTKWDEHGDCWCAAPDDSGVQLAVLTPHKFSPEELVIEHVMRSATLNPGATPRHFDLFAHIPLKHQDYIAEVSAGMFPHAPEEKELNYDWVRIGSGTYDTNGETVQVFPIQVELGRYRLSSKEFVVRFRDNWGNGDDEDIGPTCIYRVRLHGFKESS